MSKPWIHAESSAKRYGGKPEDYIEIHNLMDSSKAVIADSRHRALTHNSWFVGTILEKIFGTTITNSAGRQISVRDIGEQHVLEDFGNRFIPSGQDYLAEIEFQDWMLSGKGQPPSYAKLNKQKRVVSFKDTVVDGTAVVDGTKEPSFENATYDGSNVPNSVAPGGILKRPLRKFVLD